MAKWKLAACYRPRGRKTMWWALGTVTAAKLGPFLLMTLSALVSAAVYALGVGWPAAAGLVALLAAHEYGHVLTARLLHLPVSKPLFIPLVGALVYIKGNPPGAWAAAAVACGGPALGAVSVLVCVIGHLWTGNRLLLVLAELACFLNLFNLIPWRPLDGGQIASAVSRRQWQITAGVLAGLLWYTHNGLLLIIIAGAVKQLNQSEVTANCAIGWCYIGLLFLLTVLSFYLSEV